MKKSLLALLASTACVTAAPAFAWPVYPSENQDYLVPYVGEYRIFEKGEEPAQFGGEYRFRVWDFGVRPTLGANVNTKGDTYAYGGFNWEVPVFTPQLLLIPNFMVGYYHHDNGKDLGGPIEFRSGLELDYQFPNTQRVGLAFNHISNASIYNHNPGAQTLLVNYSIPVGSLW